MARIEYTVRSVSGLVHFHGRKWSSIDDDVLGAQIADGAPTEVLVLSASAL